MNTQRSKPFPNDLIGVCKTIGQIGPPYQIIGPGGVDDGLELARIVLLESGQETRYPIQDVMTDPLAP